MLWKHGIRHSDPSLGNVMVRVRNGEFYGVMNDWDLATLEDKSTHNGLERTGTVPFMALDLLNNAYWEGKISRLYRHDLESFFYMLCYFCSQFRSGDAANPQPYFAYLPEWEKGDIDKLYLTRQKLLLQPDAFDDLFNETSPTFQPLVERWVTPLYEQIFVRIPGYNLRMLEHVATLQLAQKRADKIKSSRYMKNLQDLTREVNEAVNYEAFREILSE